MTTTVYCIRLTLLLSSKRVDVVVSDIVCLFLFSAFLFWPCYDLPHLALTLPLTPTIKQGSWHLPAGAEDDWLCIDVPRGLRLGLDRLPPPLPPPGLQRRHAPAESGAPKNEADVAAPNDEADVAAGGPEVFSIEREGRKFGVSDERPDSKIREASGCIFLFDVWTRDAWNG